VNFDPSPPSGGDRKYVHRGAQFLRRFTCFKGSNTGIWFTSQSAVDPLAADQPRRLLFSGGDTFHSHQKGERWVPRELRGFTLPASGSDLRKGKIGTLAKKRSPKRSRNFGMIRFLLGEKTERSAH